MGLLEVNNTAWATVFDVQITPFTRGIISATQECPADFLASDNTVEKSCLLSLLLRCQRCYGADLECNDRMSPTVLERMYLTISDPSSARYFALYGVAGELAVAGAFGAEIWYFVAVPSSALSDMAGPDIVPRAVIQ